MTPYRTGERVRVAPQDPDLPDLLAEPPTTLLFVDRAAYKHAHEIPAWHVRHIDRHMLAGVGEEAAACEKRAADAKREPRFAPFLCALVYWGFLLAMAVGAHLAKKQIGVEMATIFGTGFYGIAAAGALMASYKTTRQVGRSLAWTAKFVLNPFTSLYLTGKEAVAALIWMNGSRDWRLAPWSPHGRLQFLQEETNRVVVAGPSGRIAALQEAYRQTKKVLSEITARRAERTGDLNDGDREAAALDDTLFARLDARQCALAPVLNAMVSDRAGLEHLIDQLYAVARENVQARTHGQLGDPAMEGRLRALAAERYLSLVWAIERGEDILRSAAHGPKEAAAEPLPATAEPPARQAARS